MGTLFLSFVYSDLMQDKMYKGELVVDYIPPNEKG